jgi:hypothetical protein
MITLFEKVAVAAAGRLLESGASPYGKTHCKQINLML